jgi:hypothetical protein
MGKPALTPSAELAATAASIRTLAIDRHLGGLHRTDPPARISGAPRTDERRVGTAARPLWQTTTPVMLG